MKQKNWKIVYSSLGGAAERAVRFLSKEIGRYVIRENGVYRIYVLPCEREGCSIPQNAVFVGLYNESDTIKKYVSEDEFPENGFLVKVIPNPDDAEGNLVLLTAHDERELFYAAVSFIDDYIPSCAPKHGNNFMPELIFDSPLPPYSYAEAPDHCVRSIFTWGHSINDYRKYIDDIARMKINELILWNDYVPLNISEIIDFAHSYGISVNLGYSWGWIAGCENITDISDRRLNELKDEIIGEYEENYAPTGCDGIYFQSFTERGDEYIGGRLIAEAVSTLVNMVSCELYKKYPCLKLQFGLHASSVCNRLEEIAKIDSRVEILWENCGEFPYNYLPYSVDDDSFENTLDFTRKLLELRGGVGVGLVFKGMITLDWTRFIHQSGPYILGENSEEIAIHDKRIRLGAWRACSSAWITNGEYAEKMLRFINENKLGEVNMCIAATLDGGIYLPFAICSQLFRTTGEDYGKTLARVLRREYVEGNI